MKFHFVKETFAKETHLAYYYKKADDDTILLVGKIWRWRNTITFQLMQIYQNYSLDIFNLENFLPLIIWNLIYR